MPGFSPLGMCGRFHDCSTISDEIPSDKYHLNPR